MLAKSVHEAIQNFLDFSIRILLVNLFHIGKKGSNKKEGKRAMKRGKRECFLK